MTKSKTSKPLRKPTNFDWLIYRLFRWWWNPIFIQNPRLLFGMAAEITAYLGGGVDYSSNPDDITIFMDVERVKEKEEVINAAHDYIRNALGVSDDAPRRFDFYARLINDLRGRTQSHSGGDRK